MQRFAAVPILRSGWGFCVWRTTRACASATGAPYCPYAILGVKRDADAATVKQAFAEKAKLFHPDLQRGTVSDPSAFITLVNAFETLGDPEARRRYDAQWGDSPSTKQSTAAPPPSAPAAAAAPGTYRNEQQGWRTDFSGWRYGTGQWMRSQQLRVEAGSPSNPGLAANDLGAAGAQGAVRRLMAKHRAALEGELHSALLKAYFGPELPRLRHGQLPLQFEGEVRSRPDCSADLLQLVSGRCLLGCVRVLQPGQPLEQAVLEAATGWPTPRPLPLKSHQPQQARAIGVSASGNSSFGAAEAQALNERSCCGSSAGSCPSPSALPPYDAQRGMSCLPEAVQHRSTCSQGATPSGRPSAGLLPADAMLPEWAQSPALQGGSRSRRRQALPELREASQPGIGSKVARAVLRVLAWPFIQLTLAALRVLVAAGDVLFAGKGSERSGSSTGPRQQDVPAAWQLDCDPATATVLHLSVSGDTVAVAIQGCSSSSSTGADGPGGADAASTAPATTAGVPPQPQLVTTKIYQHGQLVLGVRDGELFDPFGNKVGQVVRQATPGLLVLWVFAGGHRNGAPHLVCKATRARLLPSRMWLFAPRSKLHDASSWYFEASGPAIGGQAPGMQEGAAEGLPRLLAQDPAVAVLLAGFETLQQEREAVPAAAAAADGSARGAPLQGSADATRPPHWGAYVM